MEQRIRKEWLAKNIKTEAELVEYASILQRFPDILGVENPIKHGFLVFWGKKGRARFTGSLIGYLPPKSRTFALSAALSQKGSHIKWVTSRSSCPRSVNTYK